MASQRQPGTGTRGWSLVAPATLLTTFAAVQLTHLRPPSPQDGMYYFQRAMWFPDVPSDHWALRIGLVAPVRLFQRLLGHTEAAYYAVPLLAGALLVVATYWVGWRLFGPGVGVGAALAVVTSGMFLNVSSVLAPDVLAAGLFAAGMAVLVHRTPEGLPPGRRACVAAGLLFAWAYLVREFVVFLFPVVPLTFRMFRIEWRRLWWVAIPAAAVFVGEMALNLVVHGNPLRRLFVTGSHGGHVSSITDSRLDALVRFPRTLIDSPGNDFVLVLLVLGLLVWWLRRPAAWVVLGWLGAFWILMTLGTGLIDPQFRFLRADKLRYWMPVLPAIAVGGVAVVHHALERAWAALRPPGPAVAGAVAVVAVVVVAVGAVAGGHADWGREIYRRNGADQLAELRGWLAENGDQVEVIWTDHHTARIMPFFTQTTWGSRVWDGEVRAFDERGVVGPTGRIRNGDPGIVVLYRFGYRALPTGYAGLPDFFHRAPTARSVLLYREDKSLIVFRVGG